MTCSETAPTRTVGVVEYAAVLATLLAAMAGFLAFGGIVKQSVSCLLSPKSCAKPTSVAAADIDPPHTTTMLDASPLSNAKDWNGMFAPVQAMWASMATPEQAQQALGRTDFHAIIVTLPPGTTSDGLALELQVAVDHAPALAPVQGERGGAQTFTSLAKTSGARTWGIAPIPGETTDANHPQRWVVFTAGIEPAGAESQRDAWNTQLATFARQIRRRGGGTTNGVINTSVAQDGAVRAGSSWDWYDFPKNDDTARTEAPREPSPPKKRPGNRARRATPATS